MTIKKKTEARKRKTPNYTYKIQRGVVKDVAVLGKGGEFIGSVSKVTKREGKGKSVYLSMGVDDGLKLHRTKKGAVRRVPKSARNSLLKKL